MIRLLWRQTNVFWTRFTIWFDFFIGWVNPSGYVCSTKGSVVGAIISMFLLVIGLLGSFWVFYRSRQRHWMKLAGYNDSPLHSHSHTPTSTANFSSSPEVIFRSVYDRLSAGGRRPFLIPFPNTQSSSHTHHSDDWSSWLMCIVRTTFCATTTTTDRPIDCLPKWLHRNYIYYFINHSPWTFVCTGLTYKLTYTT